MFAASKQAKYLCPGLFALKNSFLWYQDVLSTLVGGLFLSWFTLRRPDQDVVESSVRV